MFRDVGSLTKQKRLYQEEPQRLNVKHINFGLINLSPKKLERKRSFLRHKTSKTVTILSRKVGTVRQVSDRLVCDKEDRERCTL